jgi:hypothetical protein
MRSLFLAFFMSSLALAPVAHGADHFPLVEGAVYEYEYSIPQESGTYIAYFAGTAEVGGAVTRVRHIVGASPYELQHFWSETAEGDKLFHGAHTLGIGSLRHFSPPILMIDEPLFVGKTWVVESVSSDGFAARVHFEVTAQGAVTVPAGTFQAFTVEDTWEFPENPPAEIAQACIRTTRGAAGTNTGRVSYADGVGEVQEVFGSRTERLLSFSTVAVQASTWSGIRMLYR